MNQFSLKRSGIAGLVAMGGIAATLALCLTQFEHAGSRLGEAQRARYDSYLLADELRQSSDELTRLARTYVVTADPKWEQQYFEVLDIRSGKKPRPQQYERIYWDFRAADIDPARGSGPAVAIEERMKSAGFSEMEFGKLKEAAANSGDLVRTETIAMNLVKGLSADASGAFTIKGEPQLERARTMMHDANYHAFKARIMKPMDEFFAALDQRTNAAVAAAQATRDRWFMAMLVLGALAGMVLAAGVVALYRSIRKSLDAAMRASEAIADGDLVTTVAPQGPQEVADLLRTIEQTRRTLAATVHGVREGADQVATASSEISHGNTDLSQRTEQQASALQQTAASMEQLGATVNRNADNARQANQLAQQASTVAVHGGEVVSQVVETMKGINESSKKISDIISVIDGIAFQTNILALNAAVEAARAGEQGRGFAVVASEVRGLAGRSAEAAKEIKTLIGNSVERVEQGATLVDKAGATMQEVVGSIRRVTDIVGEISEASAEQSTGVAQVGGAVTQIDQVTQQNAALVEESAAAAESLRHQAAELVRAVAKFRTPEDTSKGSLSSQVRSSARAGRAAPSATSRQHMLEAA